MLYMARGSKQETLDHQSIRDELQRVFERLGPRSRVLAVPPDYTRAHSGAGLITRIAAEYYGDALSDIMPALGTHRPMRSDEIERMFGARLSGRIRRHNWRRDTVMLGSVDKSLIEEKTDGLLSFDWPIALNRLVAEGGHDLILSIGQVVPHEVTGMSNHSKNILVGTGGKETINRSHFLGAVVGMERLMGRAQNPLRDLLNHAAEKYLSKLPILYILTVVGEDEGGKSVLRGLFAGDDADCFYAAAALSAEINISLLSKPAGKMIVCLDPEAYQSTWLGNKSIYRTRMALKAGGDLVVLAPGVKTFGEDRVVDALIRKYGYRGRQAVLERAEKNRDLAENLAAAAHLIHGSAEGRFSVTYCTNKLSQREIESVGYRWASPEEMLRRYDPSTLRSGWNTIGGEEIYFIGNPALGLWTA